MQNYAVFLEGNGFEIMREGAKEMVGFFVTVRVEAESEDEAIARAIEVVKSSEQLKEAFTPNASVAPWLEAILVHELLPNNRMENTKLAFFPMG